MSSNIDLIGYDAAIPFGGCVMKKRVGIYLRVSTDGQTTQNQRRELEAVAARSGWEVVAIYEDAGISGSNGREKRPGFDRLLNDATTRKINMIAAWSVDRLGRSLQHLVGFLNELQALNCHLYLHQQAIDTTTPSGRAMFQMCRRSSPSLSASMIVERVNCGPGEGEGQRRQAGPREPKGPQAERGRKAVGDDEGPNWKSASCASGQRDMGLVKIGRTLGVGTSVVQRVLGQTPP